MTDRLDYGAVEDRTMPAVVYALYLLGFATFGATTLVGLIIAYASQAGAGPQSRSHYTFLIRTFWLSLAFMVVAAVLFAFGLPLSLILIGIPLLLLAKAVVGLTCIWFAVRAILGVVFLARGEGYPRPYAWII
ncbi:MAG: hypothetical protein ABI655_14315 [Phenylobacterium sp.]